MFAVSGAASLSRPWSETSQNQEARAQAPDLDRHTIAADRGLPIPIKLEGEYVCGA
jgi:hypothetical protein